MRCFRSDWPRLLFILLFSTLVLPANRIDLGFFFSHKVFILSLHPKEIFSPPPPGGYYLGSRTHRCCDSRYGSQPTAGICGRIRALLRFEKRLNVLINPHHNYFFFCPVTYSLPPDSSATRPKRLRNGEEPCCHPHPDGLQEQQNHFAVEGLCLVVLSAHVWAVFTASFLGK